MWCDFHDQSLCIMNVTNKISKEWYLMWEVLEEYNCWKISLERGSWAYIYLSWCEWTQGNWGADKTGWAVFYLIWANILNWTEYFRKLLHQRIVQVVSLRLVSVCCGSFGFVHSELGGWGWGDGGGKRGSGGARLLRCVSPCIYMATKYMLDIHYYLFLCYVYMRVAMIFDLFDELSKA